VNLSDFRTRLTDLSGIDLNLNEDRLNRICNDAYLELCAAADWWWLETHELLRFNAPATTKSFVAALGTAEITPAATADQVPADYAFGWAVTGEHAYRLSAVATASPFALTLDSNWIEASGTYAIALWNDTVPLSATCDRPVALIPRGDPNTIPLRLVPMKEIEIFGPDVADYAADIATIYSVYREPVFRSAQMALRIYPPPSEITEYVFRYKQTGTAMADDTATTLLPPKYENCLVAAAQLKYLKLNREDMDLISQFELEYQKAFMRLRGAQSRTNSVVRSMGKRGVLTEASIAFKLTGTESGI